MNSRILWVDDDILRLRRLVHHLEQQGMPVKTVGDFNQAISLLNQGEPIDLFLIDLIAPWHSFESNEYPYELAGLNFISHLRTFYDIWTPVIILTVVSHQELVKAQKELKIFRLLRKGEMSPAELTQHIKEGLEYGSKMSIDRGLLDNDPIPLGNIALDATIDRLLSENRQAIFIGIQSAQFIGGPEIIQALTHTVQRAISSKDQKMFRMLVKALAYIEKNEWFEAPSFVVDADLRLSSRDMPDNKAGIISRGSPYGGTRLEHPPKQAIPGRETNINPENELPTVDFGIVTALPVELEALLNQLGQYTQVTYEQSDTRTYYRSNINLVKTGLYRVVVTMLPRMGNLEAALATNDLIRLWHPRYVLMLGIAGGTSKSKQTLGDVVISERIFYYESAKIAKRTETRPRVLLADTLLYDRALNFRSADWYKSIPTEIRRPNNLHGVPAVHFGPIASGEKVIADRQAVEFLRSLQPKLVAIEMEGAGVAAAALGAVRHVGFMAIRGLCDFADETKDDHWQTYAAYSAATFTVKFLKSCPVKPISYRVEEKERLKTTAVVPLIGRTKLFNRMSKILDLEEFKTLCFLLDVDVDDIPGDRKSSKVRELILRFERRGQLDLVEKTFGDMVQE